MKPRFLLAAMATACLLPACAPVNDTNNASKYQSEDATSFALHNHPPYWIWSDAYKNLSEAEKRKLEVIVNTPTGNWLGQWSGTTKEAVSSNVSQMAQNVAPDAYLPLVVYYVPGRDCGNYSSGGAPSADNYKSWIEGIAIGLGQTKAMIVLEPDSLGLIDCVDKEERYGLFQYAIKTLKSHNPSHKIYIDAGHSAWNLSGNGSVPEHEITPDGTEMRESAKILASRLKSAGITDADGFALNVSNYKTTDSNITYGEILLAELKDLGVKNKGFVIDSSRNGNGAPGAPPADLQEHELADWYWCNPRGSAIGQTPNWNPSQSGYHGNIWGKRPGESDGQCSRNDPPAGQFDPQLALELVES